MFCRLMLATGVPSCYTSGRNLVVQVMGGHILLCSEWSTQYLDGSGVCGVHELY